MSVFRAVFKLAPQETQMLEEDGVNTQPAGEPVIPKKVFVKKMSRKKMLDKLVQEGPDEETEEPEQGCSGGLLTEI